MENIHVENEHAFRAIPSEDGKRINIDLAAREEDFPFPELKSGKSSKIELVLEAVGTNGESGFCMLIQYGYGYLYRASEETKKYQLALYPLYPSLKDGTYNVTKLDLEPG